MRSGRGRSGHGSLTSKKMQSHRGRLRCHRPAPTPPQPHIPYLRKRDVLRTDCHCIHPEPPAGPEEGACKTGAPPLAVLTPARSQWRGAEVSGCTAPWPGSVTDKAAIPLKIPFCHAATCQQTANMQRNRHTVPRRQRWQTAGRGPPQLLCTHHQSTTCGLTKSSKLPAIACL